MVNCVQCETTRQVIQACNELKLKKSSIIQILPTHDKKYVLIFEE